MDGDHTLSQAQKALLEVRDKLVEYFPKQVLSTFIRETSVLAEVARVRARPHLNTKKAITGAEDYAHWPMTFCKRGV